MIATIASVLPIFLLIMSGFLLKRKVYPQDAFWKTAESMTYYVFFPCLLVLKVGSADFGDFSAYSLLVGIVVGVTLFIAALVFLLRRFINVSNELFTSVFQGSTRYNSYVFLGLALSVYGDEGVAVAGVFIAYMIIFTNVLSVAVLNYYGSGSKKSFGSIALNIVKNPLIIGSLVGMFLNFADVQVGGPLEVFMRYLGNAASPLSLLSVGAGLTFACDRQKAMAIFSSTTLKLLVMPLFTYILITRLGLTGLPAKIALLYSCLPTAGNAYILARQMGGDADAMASIITATTLASSLSCLIFIGLV